jgi:transcription elongation factor Elf1
MPVDNYEEDSPSEKDLGAKRTFKDFDCPGCNANNPCDPPLGHGDEVLCNYCGTEFQVKVTEDGKLKFRET